MNNTITIIILVFFETVALSAMGVSHPDLVFTTLAGTREKWFPSYLILKEAYEKLGYTIDVSELPAHRSLIEANQGNYDGEVFRKEGIEKEFSNLIRIEVQVNRIKIVAFSKQGEINMQNSEQASSLKFGVLNGMIIAEEVVKNTKHKVAISSISQLVKLLDFGRLDVIVIERSLGWKAFRDNEIDTTRITESNLTTIPLFHYLHKKHKALAPTIEGVLVDMERSGRIDEILRQ